MSPSLTFLERCRSDTGFQVDVLEKVVRLGELAADVARHPFLGPSLALKGGTALNLVCGVGAGRAAGTTRPSTAWRRV